MGKKTAWYHVSYMSGTKFGSIEISTDNGRLTKDEMPKVRDVISKANNYKENEPVVILSIFKFDDSHAA